MFEGFGVHLLSSWKYCMGDTFILLFYILFNFNIFFAVRNVMLWNLIQCDVAYSIINNNNINSNNNYYYALVVCECNGNFY